MTAIKYRYEDVDGLKVFYREAGHADASALLLLHGFPSASHMFRDLIPLLADRFHIIAPDLPGFSQSEMPARSRFTYTFGDIADVIDRFTEVVCLKRFAIYVFDYGAPTGLPDRYKTSGPHHRNNLPERQCLRGGIERELEPHPCLLARPVTSQSRSPSGLPDAGGDTSGNTPTAWPTRRRFPPMVCRSTISIWRGPAPMRSS